MKLGPELDRGILDDAQDFYSFIQSIILPHEPEGFKAQSDFHKSLIMTACFPISATAAPRGFLKSTIFSRYRPLYQLVRNRPPKSCANIEYLLVSESTSIAIEHLDWIKRHIESNPYLIASYGHLKPTNSQVPWSRDEIQLTNGSRCKALGSDSQMRGRHPTDILVDDLESHKNMDTPEKLARLKGWFYRSLMGTMIPETRLTVIGTIIEKESLLTELIDKPEFHGRIWRALEQNEDGSYRSLWEEQWPVEQLLRRKKLIGHHQFEAEFQNNPIGGEQSIIWPEWIARHAEHMLESITPIRRYMAVDIAVTEERWGDYSAISIFDEVQNGKLYERVSWRKRVSAPELRDTIHHFYYTMSKEVPEFLLGIEEVATQKFMRQMLTERDPSMQIIPLRPDKDKVRRLVDVSRYFESRTISFHTQSLVDEVLAFPRGVKDRVDTVVYVLKMYEKNHPYLLGGESSTLPITSEMNQLDFEFQLMRQSMFRQHGIATDVPMEFNKRFDEAQAIDGFFDEVEM